MQLTTLPSILACPGNVSSMTGEQWNKAILHARRTQSLGQLAARLASANRLDEIPRSVLRHLDLAHLTARRRAEAATWEIDVIRRTIDPDTPIVLLKGCAYVLANDINADGRLFSDIDVLVPRGALGKTEAALTGAGWLPSRVSDYDQHYYRDWSHEVPPMEHVRRHTVVDLHHAIIPPVSRYSFPTQLLLDDLDEVQPGIFVLSAADRVIHCAIHLIQEGESSKVFRDLYDLFLLLEQHFPDSASSTQLLSRAEKLGLHRLVATAIRAATTVFGIAHQASAIHSPWLAKNLINAAASGTPDNEGRFQATVSRLALLAQSHWMKMPLQLLLPHLCRKAMLSLFAKEEPAR